MADSPTALAEAIVALSGLTHAGSALVMAAKLDDELQKLLLIQMQPISNRLAERLFTGYGPLASFAAKIDVCYALKLIEQDTYEDLAVIREIRNHFAHSTEITDFNTAPVQAICNKFKKKDEPPPKDALGIFWWRTQSCSKAIRGKTENAIFATVWRDPDEPVP
jgi:DNA-binding MltR family transcriptional regulator